MAEYIKRETAIKAVEKADYTAIADDADSCKADYLREIIESVPAADVAPVVHGRWIQVDSTKCRCSHCDIIALIALYPHGDKNFCPNCGAKMDRGAE